MLDRYDVSLIKGMLKRGDRQSDIAAFFGINGGRVAEINTGQRFQEVAAASFDALPPPGPYQISVRQSMRAVQTLKAMRELIDDVLSDLEDKNDNEMAA